MEERGVTSYVITTETFVPLVEAQAKARNVEARLIVVPHPIGGLNAEELEARIDIAANGLREAIGL